MTTRRRVVEGGILWGTMGVLVLALAVGSTSAWLGSPEPGSSSWLGFAAEAIAALWMSFVVGTALWAGVCVWRRRRWLGLVGVIVCSVATAWELWPMPTSEVPVPGHTLRVASVNLLGENHGDPEMVPAIKDLDADVLVLTEFSSSWQRELEAAFVDDYPHRWLAEPQLGEGHDIEGLRMAVWSRVPESGAVRVLQVGGVDSQLRIPLVWRRREFALYAIHLRLPVPYRFYTGAWQDRRDLLRWVDEESLPVIVAGDFNATPRSGVLQRLRDRGFASASEAVWGRAPATWPMSPWVLPPLRIAIDHILCDGSFVVEGFGLGRPTGSDHLAIRADVSWRWR